MLCPQVFAGGYVAGALTTEQFASELYRSAGGGLFEEFNNLCAFCVSSYFGSDLRYQFSWCNWGRFDTNGRLASRLFISVVQIGYEIVGHCVSGWWKEREKREHVESLMAIVEEGRNINCRAPWGCLSHTTMSARQDCESNTVLGDILVDQDVFDSMIFSLLTLHPWFPCWSSALLLIRVRWYCMSYLSASLATTHGEKSCTVGLFIGTQYDSILWLINSGSPSLKGLFNKYWSYNLLLLLTIFTGPWRRQLWAIRLMSSSHHVGICLAITSSVAYGSKRQLMSSICSVTLPLLSHLFNFDIERMFVLTAIPPGHVIRKCSHPHTT